MNFETMSEYDQEIAGRTSKAVLSTVAEEKEGQEHKMTSIIAMSKRPPGS